VYLKSSGSPGNPLTIRAADGAVPMLVGPNGNNQTGFGAGAVVHDIVIEGLWSTNWRWGGFGFSFSHKGCHDITLRYVVADQNQNAGITAGYADDMTVEHSIASRNGWGPNSWTSNINFYHVGGSNLVRGNVAFHGIDTSSHQTDGNGLILDVSLDKGTTRFENNIAFLMAGRASRSSTRRTPR
jgi:hypothetical protein